MEKGDTVFFHPLLLHGSGPNRTKVKSLMQFFFSIVKYILGIQKGNFLSLR
jgi:ectoine hydroxylase-related dioxygenase (phytanoyl-CoA dioxygenase family)